MKRWAQHNREGFTIVELLIVVVIIGVLAGLVVVTFAGIQQRAQATAIADGFKKIEKAFHVFAVEKGMERWYLDTDPMLYSPSASSYPGNPTITSLIAGTDFKNGLNRIPKIEGSTGYFFYDNDNDTYNPAVCSTLTTGVNLIFANITQDVATEVDKILDDGNIGCGKLRFYSGNRIAYLLSGQQQY